MTDHTPLTEQQLTDIEALTSAATAGPWSHTDSGAIIAPLTQQHIADVWEPNVASRNGDFIEAARDAVPALLTEVRRLRAAMEEIRHLHKDSPMGPCPTCIDSDAIVAGGDGLVPYPCPTGRLAGAQDCDPPHVRAAIETGTGPCGHDDYHDGHPWHDKPGVWCPGINDTTPTTETSE